MAKLQLKRGENLGISTYTISEGELLFNISNSRLTIGDVNLNKREFVPLPTSTTGLILSDNGTWVSLPTSLPNPNALTIQTDGTTKGTYDGSSAVTINITKSDIGLSNVTNESKATMFANPTFTGTITGVTPTVGDNTTKLATTAFVNTAITNGLSTAEAMRYKGTIGTGGTYTTVPTTYKVGDTYKIITNGTYAGYTCEIGDTLIANIARTGTGNLNTDWDCLQANITGAIVAGTGITTGYLASFQSTTSLTSIQYGTTATANLIVQRDASGNILGDILGNAATATSRTIDGVAFNHSANITHYATSSTAAATAAKVAALTGFALATGASLKVKFTVTNTAANPTLNVNSTGAKAIFYRGSAITAGTLATNRVYEFIYDGTNYELVGDVDTNTVYTHPTDGSGAVGTHFSVTVNSAGHVTAGSTDIDFGVIV